MNLTVKVKSSSSVHELYICVQTPTQVSSRYHYILIINWMLNKDNMIISVCQFYNFLMTILLARDVAQIFYMVKKLRNDNIKISNFR